MMNAIIVAETTQLLKYQEIQFCKLYLHSPLEDKYLLAAHHYHHDLTTTVFLADNNLLLNHLHTDGLRTYVYHHHSVSLVSQ